MKLIKKNRTKTDCGVVAAFNAASWCNLYKPYNQVERLARSCGYSPERGIMPFQFVALLKKLRVPVKKIYPKSMAEMESKIYLGKFLVLLYMCTGRVNGHAVVIFLDHKGHIRLINPELYDSILTWNDLAAEVNANGMKEFHVYEIPHRKIVKGMIAK